MHVVDRFCPGAMVKALPRLAMVCAAALVMAVTARTSGAAANGDVVAIDTAAPQFRVSDRLVGLHFVYSSEQDEIYADGAFARWAREAGITLARYPGGTVVQYWNWRAPTGVLVGDNWDPDWSPASDAPPDEWMSLDEYLAFVKASGIAPVFGVNSLSGERFDRRGDSIERAAAMVRYVKAQGLGGADWYIGNEDIHRHGGIEAFAAVFAEHAVAMKREDPEIRVFWNDNPGDPERIRRFLAHDRGTADGFETHGKWPYGGDPPGLEPGTFDEWRREHPLRDRKNFDRKAGGRVWREAADFYREIARQAGRPDLLIANNEYGLGKEENLRGFDRYSRGLLLTDFLSELLIGNWDRTAFWSTVLPGASDHRDGGGLLSTRHGYRKNPFHLGMALIAAAQGGAFLRSFTLDDSSYGYAVKQGDTVLVFVLNKSDGDRAVRVRFDGFRLEERLAATAMVETDDGFGAYRSIEFRGDGDSAEFVALAMSFTRADFRIEGRP